MQQGRAGGERGRGLTSVPLGWLMVLLCLLAGPIQAVGLVDLDIAPQELTTALEQFSRATGMAVLVDHQLSSQRQTLGVQGRFTPPTGCGCCSAAPGWRRIMPGRMRSRCSRFGSARFRCLPVSLRA